MAVIAISQQIGSRGIELGRLTADRLGYRLITGEEIVAEAARRYNVSETELLLFDLRKPHFWERVRSEGPRYMAYFRASLLHAAAGGRVILAGRTLAHQMPQLGGVMRLRVVAPIEDRIQQVATEEKISTAAADRQVREHDREVKARTQSLSGIDLDDPSLYDVVMNTFHHSLDTMAACLADSAARIDEFAAPDAHQKLLDAALAAGVHAALLAHPKVRDAEIAVTCESGTVKLTGEGLVPPWDELVSGIARGVEGVVAVEVAGGEPAMPLRTD